MAEAKKTGPVKPANRELPEAFIAQKFQKGKSGNPSGRPKKVASVEDEALKQADKALAKLVKLIDSDDERVALQAAQTVLDRAVGKAKQAMKIDADHKHDHGEESLSDTAKWIADRLRERTASKAAESLPN